MRAFCYCSSEGEKALPILFRQWFPHLLGFATDARVTLPYEDICIYRPPNRTLSGYNLDTRDCLWWEYWLVDHFIKWKSFGTLEYKNAHNKRTRYQPRIVTFSLMITGNPSYNQAGMIVTMNEFIKISPLRWHRIFTGVGTNQNQKRSGSRSKSFFLIYDLWFEVF